MEKTYRLKRSPVTKSIFLRMLTPTIFMNLTTAIGSMADTVIIGQYLDDSALSVVTFAMPIFMIINLFAALFAVGGCIAMSIDSGRGEKETANKAFSLSMELMAAVSTVMFLTGLFFSGTITKWLGAEKDVFEAVQLYSKIILMGAPLFIFNIGFAFFVRNDGNPTLSMIGMFSSIVVDIVLNVVFVGSMGMGVAGAAYSTVIGSLVSVIIISIHFLTSKNTLRFRFTFGMMALRIMKNGGSAALHFVYQFVTILIINHLLASLAGTNGVVVYTVVFNLATVSLSVFEGISQTIQPMVSNYYGEESPAKTHETLRLALLAILVICCSVTLVLELFPQIVPILFRIDDTALIQNSAVAVRIYAVSMVITTINVVLGYYLQSTEENFTAAVFISLRCLILFLGFTLLLGLLFGMNGIWAAYTAAEVLSTLICILMLWYKQRKLKQKNIRASLLLLDEDARSQTECYTFCCKAGDYDSFTKAVCTQLAQRQDLDEALYSEASRYLAVLAQCCINKSGKYVEVEIPGKTTKIIIRDNLDHSTCKDSLSDPISPEIKADYGPVLGWNRICLERGT